MATVSINSEQITSIANSLKSKGEQILTQYKDTCASALQMSTQCLQMSGLDTEQFFKALENVYSKLNDRLKSLADFLINNVAAEYDALTQAISNSFNNDFANEIAGLMGIAGLVGGSGSIGGGSGGTGGGSGGTGGSGGGGGSKTSGGTSQSAVKKTEPSVIMRCDGYYKAVKNCSGQTVYTKISDSEMVIRNCSGQMTVIKKTQSAQYQMEQAAKSSSPSKSNNTSLGSNNMSVSKQAAEDMKNGKAVVVGNCGGSSYIISKGESAGGGGNKNMSLGSSNVSVSKQAVNDLKNGKAVVVGNCGGTKYVVSQTQVPKTSAPKPSVPKTSATTYGGQAKTTTPKVISRS